MDGTCQKTCTPVAHITNYTDVPNGNQTALEAAIAQQVRQRVTSSCWAASGGTPKAMICRRALRLHNATLYPTASGRPALALLRAKP